MSAARALCCSRGLASPAPGSSPSGVSWMDVVTVSTRGVSGRRDTPKVRRTTFRSRIALGSSRVPPQSGAGTSGRRAACRRDRTRAAGPVPTRASSSTTSGATAQSKIAPPVPVSTMSSRRRGMMSRPGASRPQWDSDNQRLIVRTSLPRKAPSWCQSVFEVMGTRRNVHLLADSAGRSPRCCVTSSPSPVSSIRSSSSKSMRGESAVHTPPLARTQPRRPATRYLPGFGVKGTNHGAVSSSGAPSSPASHAESVASIPSTNTSTRSRERSSRTSTQPWVRKPSRIVSGVSSPAASSRSGPGSTAAAVTGGGMCEGSVWPSDAKAS